MSKRTTKRSRSVAASRVKAGSARSSAGKLVHPKSGELITLLDFVRYAVSRFVEARLVFAHGTTDPVAEAAFLVCDSLYLHPDQFESFASSRVTRREASAIFDLIARRIATRQPAAYLVNKSYMHGLPFYVDKRTIVPRSFIGELLDTHFSGEDASLIDDPNTVGSVLDLCTGSGCLAILAARHFPNAGVDAVDLSADALEVAARNISDYGLGDRVTLLRGDLFTPLGDRQYDLIISNPPYVDAQGMAGLPAECRHEPEMAFDGGDDGLDVVRRILAGVVTHLTPSGALLCEVGRGRAAVETAFPYLPLLWLDTEESQGEVFWIAAGDLSRIDRV